MHTDRPEVWLALNDAVAVLDLYGPPSFAKPVDAAPARARFAESQQLRRELGMDAELIRARETWFEAVASAASIPRL